VVALALSSCGDTLQDQPVGVKLLESVIVKSRFPVYWVGQRFHGMRITNVLIDPGGAVTIRYGDCLVGGQYTCVTPLSIVTSPDNGFIPGATTASGRLSLRGARAYESGAGATLAIPTGGIVVNLYSRRGSLARLAAETMVPLNKAEVPGARLPPAEPDTGFDRVPLPSQVPPGVDVTAASRAGDGAANGA
jgi:hypothetical protein